jgi:uncharacterized protein (DUF983 family)
MLKKGTKLNSILTGSCPKCQEESMYVTKNPYIIGKTLKMQEYCGHCKLKYMIEPNFFFGAMYVSYGVSIAIGVALFIIVKLLFEFTLDFTFITISIGLLLLMPVVARVSRNIYINFFVNFDKDWNKHS